MIKSKLMISLLIAVSITFFATPLFSKEGYQVSYTAEFFPNDLSFDKLKGYDIVNLRAGGFLAELGKPMLPSKELKIALPAGMAVKNVYVVNTQKEEIPGEYNIFPSQPPLRTGLSDKNADFVQPDSRIYTSNQPYPSNLVEFVHQTDLAGQGIAVIQVYPLQYTPSEKRLMLYTSVTLVIEGVGGYQCGDYLSPNISEKERETYQQMIRSMVNNPEDVQLNSGFNLTISMVPPGGPFAHVIITSTTYASYFQPLVDWHTEKGVKDTVITTAWIYSNYTGADSQKIRAFVMDAHSTWGTTYFLMGGEHETVPFVYRTYYSESAPSDQYYSDYDNDWTHEVFVGRVSVGSTIEVTTFVNKVLKYEKNPPRTNYPLDVLLVGMDLDASTRCELLKEDIDTYIPPQFNLTKVYDSHATNHRTATINALNAGQNLVNHADHSYIDVMGTGDYHHGWAIYSSDVDGLVNDNQLSVIVSMGCDPNRMDANDCIAEHFVIYNPNQGGVSFTGNTRSGWYYGGNPYSLSNALEKQWWVGLFSRDKYNLGQTIVDSKHNFSHSQAVEKQCEWTFNLLGEPEMPIWTDEPDSFAVTCPSEIPLGSSSFPVHVEDATTHADVNQAYVCLWKANEVYLTGSTDASGDITFTPSPSAEGSMYVTVTKHNYLPYQQQVNVTGYYMIGDANGDYVVDIADVVFLINYLFVGGPAPVPLDAGDANCDGVVDAADVIHLINYLFVAGPPPSC
jgi:hypothetical protein